MGTLRLFVNESASDPRDALVESFLSPAPARQLVFTQGDTARPLEIHFLERNIDPNSDQPFIYGTAPSSVKFGVGGLDTPPTGGFITITENAAAETTAEIAYNASAATLQTALRAGASTNLSLCTVTGSYTEGYTIDAGSFGALVDITVSVNGISPENSVCELTNTENGTASLSEKWFFKVVKPMSLSQTSFSNVTYTAPTSASVTTGASGVNAVHRLTWPSAAYAGSISISQAIPTSATAVSITSNTAASPTVFTTATHGLTTGDQIYIPSNNGSNATVLGVHTVTVTDATHFSIPIDCTSAGGTGGSFYKVSTQTIGPIPYNVGTSALEDLFEEHAGALSVDGNFAAEKVAQGNYLITFKGGLASTPVPVGTVTSNLSTPVAVSGTLNCKTAGMLNLLGTSQEATTKMEIEKTVSSVPTTVAYRDDVKLRAELIPT